MEFSEDRRADAVILALTGRLDATTAKAFEDRILDLIGSGPRRLVVDLAHVEYVSSSGLRVFLIAAKRLHNTDKKIALCSLNEHVRQVFDLAGFSSLLSIYNSRDDALNAL